MQLLRAHPCNFNSAPDFLAYKWGMYQVIDDQDEEDFAPPRGFSVLPFIIGAILAGIVFFIVWLMSPGQQIAPGQSVETPASRAAYLTALSERNPAVRRARLMDYQREHPDTDRSDAIEGQLDVINAAELTDWDNLVQVIYNETLPLDDKREAFAAYEAAWNGRLLGGRGEDLEDLRAILDDTRVVDSLPDRALEVGESPISETIPAKRRNIGAIVVVSMNINNEGRVDSVDIVDIEAERYEKDFIRAAKRAAKRTRFHPKTVNGKAVPAMDVRKRYIFRSN